LIKDKYKSLIEKAIEARENAYVPYSDFKVGAAVLTDKDQIFTGCNVETASFGGTICAERTAMVKAVSNGNRSIKAIAVVGKEGSYTFPCGICRQFIIEFGRDIEVIVVKTIEDFKIFSIEELLPYGFTREDL